MNRGALNGKLQIANTMLHFYTYSKSVERVAGIKSHVIKQRVGSECKVRKNDIEQVTTKTEVTTMEMRKCIVESRAQRVAELLIVKEP